MTQFATSPLSFSDRITCLPVVHGSGDCAMAVRRWLLEHPCDCIAVELPESFKEAVIAGVENLPKPSIVIQPAQSGFESQLQQEHSWQPDDEDSDDESDEDAATCSYVPIDPCQPVIMALRVALGEHWPIEFCDLETAQFEPIAAAMPDPYALKTVPLERFATAILPSIPRPFQQQANDRIRHMAHRLCELEKRHKNIVVLCNILSWPWLHEAYREAANAQQPEQTTTSDTPPELPVGDDVAPAESFAVNPNSLIFLFGELPYITGLYEQARMQLEDDTNLSIDGVKQLLMSARSSYLQDLGKRARKITPLLLMQCLKYTRNLTILEHRMTPDLYTIATSAQQILGDQFAVHAIDTARNYPFYDESASESVTLGIDQARLPNGDTVSIVSRLPGQPVSWRSMELKRKPTKLEREKWQMQWNPMSQCSWPPEDNVIESFRTRVMDRAKAIIGADLARSEKFSSSIKDGIDIRETLRHWYDGDIYVKVNPPSIGKLDCCIMLFDTPADPREYTWRATWFAEHEEESTLAFFATDFRQEMVGPGIGLATYGGSMFLYPPVSIRDIWQDPNLDFADSLEDRLVAAACLHARERQIAFLSEKPPTAAFRNFARRSHKNLVHIPMSHFNDAMVQQLRMVHVLNGHQVRSFAEQFIRKA